MNKDDVLETGVRFVDREEPGAYLDVLPQAPSGNVEIEVGFEDGTSEAEGFFVSLNPEQQRMLAELLVANLRKTELGAGKSPARGRAHVRVDMPHEGEVSAEELDWAWQRAGWHVAHNVPAKFSTVSGVQVRVLEVASDDRPGFGMSEVKRSYRYRLPGDAEGDWRYHTSFGAVKRLGPVEVHSQRSFKSSWTEERL